MGGAHTPYTAVTVLVVEDDAEVLAADCAALGGHFRVLTATSGEEALCIARQARPEAIVLDIMMPEGWAGFSVFRELCKDPATRHIPVIFLTAFSEVTELPLGSEEIGRYLGAEPAAFLEKPVSAEVLRQTVARVVEAVREPRQCKPKQDNAKSRSQEEEP